MPVSLHNASRHIYLRAALVFLQLPCISVVTLVRYSRRLLVLSLVENLFFWKLDLNFGLPFVFRVARGTWALYYHPGSCRPRPVQYDRPLVPFSLRDLDATQIPPYPKQSKWRSFLQIL